VIRENKSRVSASDDVTKGGGTNPLSVSNPKPSFSADSVTMP